MRDGDDKSYVITGDQNDSDPDQASEPEQLNVADADQSSEPEQLTAADADQASDISEPEIISSISNSNGGKGDGLNCLVLIMFL